MFNVQPLFLRILAGVLSVVALSAAAFRSDALSAAAAGDNELEEIIVSVPEPRYVAPTRRDRIGRIWAPVYINEKGPFRLVLDTGATHSAITSAVAAALDLSPNPSESVTLRGATATAVVPTVRVHSLIVGDLMLSSKRVPIIADALGGAEGILGTEGLADKRIHIDFRHDLILIRRSRGERAAPGFVTIPVKFSRGILLTVDARIGAVRVKAIIDTGSQTTIANLATRDALFQRQLKEPTIDSITGATADVQQGEGYTTPPIVIGGIQIRSSRITFGDLHLFEHWKLTDEPAIMIGMDALGLLDTLIIDYPRAELQVRMHNVD